MGGELQREEGRVYNLYMNKGWIKLHRKFTEWEWYADSNTKSLFLHILLKCNHEEKKWHGETVKSGQIIIGIENLGKEIGLTRQQARTSLNRLKSTSEITSKSTNKFSILTVVNWENYQNNNQQLTSKPTNEQPTNNQQITTTKELKNVKNEKKSTPTQKRGELFSFGEEKTELLNFFNQACGKNYKLTPDKQKQIKERLVGFTVEEIKKAVQNRLADTASMGKNKDKKIWANDWNSLFRNDTNMDRALNLSGTFVRDDEFYISELNQLGINKFIESYGENKFCKYSDHYQPKK